MDLTSIEDVKALLGPNFGTQGDQSLIEIISIVSGQIETYLDRKITTGTYIEQLDVKPLQWKFYLKAYPIVSVTSIYNDYDRVFDSSSLVEAADYYVDLERGAVAIDRTILTSGNGVLKITYSGGMAADQEAFKSAYPDIAGACAQECAARWLRKGNPNTINATIGGATVSLISRGQFLPDVKDVLDNHVRMAFDA